MNEKFKKDEVWGYLGGGRQRDKAEGMEDNAVNQNLGHEGRYGSAPNLDPNVGLGNFCWSDTLYLFLFLKHKDYSLELSVIWKHVLLAYITPVLKAILCFFSVQPAYKKDEFFDTISCNSLARGPRNDQNRFSGRMKHDTEVSWLLLQIYFCMSHKVWFLVENWFTFPPADFWQCPPETSSGIRRLWSWWTGWELSCFV